jgi:hypothetical protein
MIAGRVERVGSIGSNTLHPADHLIHASVGSVWHAVRMANLAAMMQPSNLTLWFS